MISSDSRFDVSLSFCSHKSDLKAICVSGLLEVFQQEDVFVSRLLFSHRVQSLPQLVTLRSSEDFSWPVIMTKSSCHIPPHGIFCLLLCRGIT